MCNICRDFNFDTGHTDRVTYRDATHLKINVFQKLTKNFGDCSTLSELKISDLKFYSSNMLVFLMSKLIVNV